MLIRRGDLGRHVYVILAGEVDVHRDGSDGPRHVRTLDQHAFIGEIAVLDDVSRTATVTAKSTLDVLEIDREVLLRMMSDEPKLADAVEHHRAGTDFYQID